MPIHSTPDDNVSNSYSLPSLSQTALAVKSSAHPKFGYEIVSINEWVNGWKRDEMGKKSSHGAAIEGVAGPNERDVDGINNVSKCENTILPLVDLRPYHEFDKRHLSLDTHTTNYLTCASSSTAAPTTTPAVAIKNNKVPIISLPLSTLISGERSCELPPRHVHFAILVPRQYAHCFVAQEKEAIQTAGKRSNGEGSESEMQNLGEIIADAENLRTTKITDSPIHQLLFSSQSKSTSQSRKPWLVRQIVIDNDSLWVDARDLGLVAEHCESREEIGNEMTMLSNVRSAEFPFQSLPRLWKPDPLISSKLIPLLKEWVVAKERNHHCRDSNYSQNLTNKTSIGIVLDLGSGAGRDICYLAEELKEMHHSLINQRQSTQQNQINSFPLHFVGVDNHKGSSKRCYPLWKNRGVDDVTNSCYLDLNKLHHVRSHFMNMDSLHPPHPQSQHTTNERKKENQRQHSSESTAESEILCIYAIRFLNRKLISYIVDSQSPNSAIQPSALSVLTSLHQSSSESNSDSKPKKKTQHAPPRPLILPIGTIVAISHFCKPYEGSDWKFDHPKESNVLERCELKKLFEGASCSSHDDKKGSDVKKWEILHDDICFDGDHGRTLIQFVARKVA